MEFFDLKGLMNIDIPEHISLAFLFKGEVKEEKNNARKIIKKMLEEKGVEVHETELQRSPLYEFNDYQLSLSHSRGSVVGALALKSDYTYLGVDLETLERKNDLLKLERKILTREEKKIFDSLEGISLSDYILLVFSIKESLYKAYSREKDLILRFDETSLKELDLKKKTFTYELKKKTKEVFILNQGVFAMEDGLLLTLVFSS